MNTAKSAYLVYNELAGGFVADICCKPASMKKLLEGLGPGLKVYDADTNKVVAAYNLATGRIWISDKYNESP